MDEVNANVADYVPCTAKSENKSLFIDFDEKSYNDYLDQYEPLSVS